MYSLTVRKNGNSLSVLLPKELINEMGVAEGDKLFVTRTEDGFKVSQYDPEFAQKMEAAKDGIRQYRNALRELAK